MKNEILSLIKTGKADNIEAQWLFIKNADEIIRYDNAEMGELDAVFSSIASARIYLTEDKGSYCEIYFCESVCGFTVQHSLISDYQPIRFYVMNGALYVGSYESVIGETTS